MGIRSCRRFNNRLACVLPIDFLFLPLISSHSRKKQFRHERITVENLKHFLQCMYLFSINNRVQGVVQECRQDTIVYLTLPNLVEEKRMETLGAYGEMLCPSEFFSGCRGNEIASDRLLGKGKICWLTQSLRFCITPNSKEISGGPGLLILCVGLET